MSDAERAALEQARVRNELLDQEIRDQEGQRNNLSQPRSGLPTHPPKPPFPTRVVKTAGQMAVNAALGDLSNPADSASPSLLRAATEIAEAAEESLLTPAIETTSSKLPLAEVAERANRFPELAGVKKMTDHELRFPELSADTITPKVDPQDEGSGFGR
jgi:hypothetical protein